MNFKWNCTDDVSVTVTPLSEQDGVAFYEIAAVYPKETIPQPLTVTFTTSAADVYSVWSPAVRYDRSLAAEWNKTTTDSRLAHFMPLHTLVSADGKNRVAVALSDAKTPTSIGSGILEETAEIEWDIKFFTFKVAPVKEYRAVIRIDTRDIAYYDAVYDAIAWWERECGYVPTDVPAAAKLPMNSLWYSFHQQLDVDEIVRECELSKPLGMDTVIIDDGWQTDDNNRGYRFCGDWEVAKSKIPDMKQFIDRIHATGMKAMLWHAIPYVGKGSKIYERFSDKLLFREGDNVDYWAFDPRYADVREYIVQFCARAVREWGLDGLKLDFIGAFLLAGRSLEYDPRRDYQSLEDAIDRLMTDITATLRAIDPEVLIEFRQGYVGPAMRKYGNILRVIDCPADALHNRQDVVNLRLTSGNTAVHSDMIMWNREDTVERAALQFANILYSVPQVSMKIATLPDDHRKMLAFYLAFWREHRDTLIGGKILAADPECAYSHVCAEKDGKAIFTAYTDTVIDCTAYGEVIAVNASRSKTLILKGADGSAYTVVNCMGERVCEGRVNGSLAEVDVPLSGMVTVLK